MITEIEPIGSNQAEIVWEWHFWDHLIQDRGSQYTATYGEITDHPELLDINVNGGGTTGQAEAIRLAISRALCDFDSNNRTECDINGKSITIEDNKKISGSPPAGLSRAYNDYWFQINDIQKNYTISCICSHDSHWYMACFPSDR